MSKKGGDVLSISLRRMHEKRERKNVTVALIVGLFVLVLAFTRLTFTGYAVETVATLENQGVIGFDPAYCYDVSAVMNVPSSSIVCYLNEALGAIAALADGPSFGFAGETLGFTSDIDCASATPGDFSLDIVQWDASNPSPPALTHTCIQHMSTGIKKDFDLSVAPDGSTLMLATETQTAPAEVCGNGIIESGEECDDGNIVSGDGCSDICQIELGGTPVTDCGFLSTPGETYVLTQDVQLTAANKQCVGTGVCPVCLYLWANDITLDCKGHSITSTIGGAATLAYGTKGQIIKNCVINNFDYGFTGQATAGSNTFINNTAFNGTYGINANGANNIISGNVFSFSNVRIIDTPNNDIISNNVFTNGSIILWSGTTNATVSNNKIVNGGIDGTPVYSLIKDNEITGSGYWGAIRLSGASDNNQLIGNKIYGLTGDAFSIYIPSASNNLISRNQIFNNTRTAVDIRGGTGNIVSDNVITSTLGINVVGTGTIVRNNTLKKNAGYPIRSISGVGHIIEGNYLESNTGGIVLWTSANATVRDNTFVSNNGGVGAVYTSPGAKVYHNNFNGILTSPKVSMEGATELSYNGEGNFWGRTTPPYFIAGTDSNRADVVDSHSYSKMNGWVGTSVNSCGTLSTAGEKYVLTQDVSSTGDCFTIGADNITLDCQGHKIRGPGNYGVVVSGKSGNVIKNCDISGFYFGIRLSPWSSSNIVSNNNASGNTEGIAFWGGNNLISNNIANSNAWTGIHIGEHPITSNNIIENNIVNNNWRWGIRSEWGGSGNIIRNNLVQESGFFDIAPYNSACTNIYENITISRGKQLGYFANTAVNLNGGDYSELILCNADGSTLSNLVIKGSTSQRSSGLWLQGTDNTTITNVNSSENYGGLAIYGGNGNIIRDSAFDSNGVYGSGGTGVYLEGSSRNVIEHNTINDNAYDGMQVQQGSNNNSIVSNSIKINNLRWASVGGIWLRGNSDNVIKWNEIIGNWPGIWIDGESSTTKITQNNIYNNGGYQVQSTVPFDVSGNFWGRTTQPYFIAGTDSNRADVVDSSPLSKQNGWICVDSDNDGYGAAGNNVACGHPGIVDCDDNNAAVYPGASDVVCNGVDDNCNGVIDDEYVPSQTNCGIGACVATGQMLCSSGQQIDSCTPGVSSVETCNNVDDDCNGVVDNEITNLITDIFGKGDTGECKMQVESCISGGWQIIQNAVGPSAEVCDNKDNDCDGLTDSVDSDMAVVSCELQAGVCSGSQHIVDQCVDGAWQQCTATEYGTSYGEETCPDDGIDNNCDGEAVLDCAALCDKDNDGYKPDGAPWYCLWPFYSAGDCDDFNALINAGASDNNCNGIDENCFNGADDGYVSTATTCGIGTCAATGQMICSGGNEVNTCTPGTPNVEIQCNNIDENCNGMADDCWDDDSDGIADVIDTQPLVYSNAFSDIGLGGLTYGVISKRENWNISVEDVLVYGVRSRVASGTGAGFASITSCANNVETQLDVAGEVAEISCGSTNTTVLAVNALNMITVREPPKGNAGKAVKVNLRTGQKVILGSYVTAGSENTEPLEVLIVDENDNVLGSGLLNPGITVDISFEGEGVIFTNPGTTIINFVLFGQTVTLGPGETRTVSPIVDQDSDGVLDNIDQCLTIAGPASRMGCPFADITKVDLQIVDQQKSGICGYDKKGKLLSTCTQKVNGAEVKIFDRENVDFKSLYKLRPNKNTLDVIFESNVGLVGSCITDSTGTCLAGEDHPGKFLVIVKYADGSNTVYSGKFKNFKMKVIRDFREEEDDDDTDVSVYKTKDAVLTKNIHFIKTIKKDGKVRYEAGMMTIVPGSQLNILYPEYTIWDNTVELYPFVMSSNESWTTDVCLQVPTGYNITGVLNEDGTIVGTSNCMQSFIADETKVVLFQINEIGSPEPEVSFSMKTTHNGKKVQKDLKISGIRKNTKDASDKILKSKVKVVRDKLAKSGKLRTR